MNSETRALWKIWGVAFAYTCLVGFFVQLILLPFLLPYYHAGGGLFTGTPDSAYFNRLAVDLAAKIRTSGWGAWELRPEGQASASILALVYALTWNKLWVLIPINALLHASAFLILFRLLSLIVKGRVKPFLCVLPFLIFPSNLQWTAQLHKDGFSILGLVLVLQGIVSLSRLENYTVKNWFIINLQSIFYCLSGFILIWIVRPIILTIIQPVLAPFFIFLIILFILRSLNKIVSWKRSLIVSSFLVLLFFILSRQKTINFRELDPAIENNELQNEPKPLLVKQPMTSEPVLTKEVYDPGIQNKPEPLPVGQPVMSKLVLTKEAPRSEIQNEPKPLLVKQPMTSEPVLTKEKALLEMVKKEKIKPEKQRAKINHASIALTFETECHWKRSTWFPVSIERRFYSLAEARWGFRNSAPEARSNIDRYVGFYSVKDVLFYIPRAAQIALLAPFPKQWFEDGKASVNSFMRKIAAFEMTVIYFALIFLPYALWHWRKRIEIWIMFVFCMYMLIIYGLVVCNVGTLYRMRYVYVTALVALGIAGFLVFLERVARIKKNGQHQTLV